MKGPSSRLIMSDGAARRRAIRLFTCRGYRRVAPSPVHERVERHKRRHPSTTRLNDTSLGVLVVRLLVLLQQVLLLRQLSVMLQAEVVKVLLLRLLEQVGCGEACTRKEGERGRED